MVPGHGHSGGAHPPPPGGSSTKCQENAGLGPSCWAEVPQGSQRDRLWPGEVPVGLAGSPATPLPGSLGTRPTHPWEAGLPLRCSGAPVGLSCHPYPALSPMPDPGEPPSPHSSGSHSPPWPTPHISSQRAACRAVGSELPLHSTAPTDPTPPLPAAETLCPFQVSPGDLRLHGWHHPWRRAWRSHGCWGPASLPGPARKLSRAEPR